jgi:excinuclease UvrABC ATPase subunit
MKGNIISYKGVRTNNLKDISLDITQGCFLGIAGPSGSGKSSLAYGTIYAIAQYEWEKVSNMPAGTYVNFKVDSYSNIIPAIALKQENLNNNPRSTIATFLRIDKDFRLLFASVNNLSPSLFSFNNPQNACLFCDGLGYESSLDQSQMIDWEKSIEDKPFLPWKKTYNQKVLEKYAEHCTIPLNRKLKDLPKELVNKLLYDKSDEKFRVSYVMGGKKRTREFPYIGLFLEMQNLKQDKQHISSLNKILDFSSMHVCSHCHGSRFSDNILKNKYKGKSLGDLYLMELSSLYSFINNSLQSEKHIEHVRLLNNIQRVIEGLIDGKLEYLHLNRSIPTLSGGELQRIRLVNILTSQIAGMMYIVDEPSARLHVSEYDSILDSFRHLRQKGNTILMIEHNPYFLRNTDKNLFIGPSSGEHGGNIVAQELQKISYKYMPQICTEFIHFNHITDNNLSNVCVNIPKKRITGLYGPSGSGKSTLARNIERLNKGTEYVNQKPLRGSIVSTIASYCGVLDDIRNVFSVANHVDSDFFSFQSEKGQCPCCKGKGMIKYSLDFGKTEVEIICDECKGQRFNSNVLEYTYKKKSIYDVLTLTINQLIDEKIFSDHASIVRRLMILRKLGLGYLSLFRTTDTLSGGESQRLKLTKFIGKKLKNRLFIFDEPLKGLSPDDAYNVLSIFKDITDNEGTVVFIEHSVLGFTACDYVIELGPGKGKNGGKVMFEGLTDSFKKSQRYLIYKDKR